MGSSAKRKKEKKQDFQKPKLKVGKAKPKAENQTNTSFRSKAIILNQQSLTESAPTITHQFQHNVSLLSSKTDSQRKDSLSYLTTFLQTKPVNMPLPQPVGTLLDRICPLILDGSLGVRTQSLKLFQSLRPEDVRDHVVKILPFIRADVAGSELVACSGGWQRTLESFTTLLGWRQVNDDTSWSSNKASFGSDIRATTRIMQVLAYFLTAGLIGDKDHVDTTRDSISSQFPLWQLSAHAIPTKSNAYLLLNLFGTPRADDNQILEDREDRLQVFNGRFRSSIMTGIEIAKQEGGELGRAAGLLTKVLKQAQG